MDIPIRKLVTTITILICIIIVLSIIVVKTNPEETSTDNIVENTTSTENLSEDEKLQQIIEDTIKEKDNVVVNTTNQTLIYDPQVLDQF